MYNFQEMPWFKYLKEIFLCKNQMEFNTDELEIKNVDSIPFFEFLRPFLKKITETIKNEFRYKFIDEKNLIKIATRNIATGILNLSYKTLIYELNNTRINGELVGQTSKERYEYFIKNKLTKEYDIVKLLSDYPVLARLISDSVRKSIDNLLKVLNRLEKDMNDIKTSLNINIEKIKDIIQLGDSHKEGETVLKIIFNNGESIIYKPRSLSVDNHFQKLLIWFNEKKVSNEFKPLKILDRKSYGWCECIENIPCKEEGEIEKFFRRQGQYLAILYMINATDFHYENIIASGEFPYLIDLEALMHPNLKMPFGDKKFAVHNANVMLSNSVMKTALLPVLAGDDVYNFDVSGLGAREQQSIEMFEITNFNTDIMKMEKKKTVISNAMHLPKIGDKAFYSENYIEEINKGFQEIYEIVLKNIQELLKEDSVISNFKDDEIRVILRNTKFYSRFLNSSTHPQYLMDGADRQILFDYLWKDSRLYSVTESECAELLYGDVPYFWCKAKETMVFGKGVACNDLLEKEAFELVLEKLSNLSEIDCSRQKDFIQKSLLVKYNIIEENKKEHLFSLKSLMDGLEEKVEIDTEIFLKEAMKIADLLYDRAIIGEDRSITWIALSMDSHENMKFNVLDGTIYEGIAGICLFNAHLAQITGVEKYKDVAQMCIKTMLREDMWNREKRNVSAYAGYGSVIYCLINLYQLWKEEWIREEIHKYLLIIKSIIDKDIAFDFLGGTAGVMCVCLDIYDILDDREALNVAELCGNHLLKNSKKMDKGIGWSNKLEEVKPLAGLAHGGAGISYALIKLYYSTNNKNYLIAALEAIEYENSLYDSKVNNWRDLRNFHEISIDQEPIAWCNGAMGIGLARLFTLDYYNDQNIRDDYKRALDKTIKDSFIEVNYCLCHGDIGNLELPLAIAIKEKDEKLKSVVYKKAMQIIKNKIDNGESWKCGIPGRYETENFMVGISGIGYQLLRLYDNNIPSILILECKR